MVHRWQASTAVLVTLLAGCATGDGREDTTIGWYCGGQGNDRQWQCERRRMRHGRPVDDFAINNSDGMPASSVAASGHQVGTDTADPAPRRNRLDSPRNRDWRQQLPALDKIPDPDGPADPVELVHRMTNGKKDADRPLPQPEPAFERWGDEPLADLERQDNKQQPHSRADPFTPSPRLAGEPARGGYTVQLGAFSGEGRRSRFVAENGIADLPLLFQRISRDGRDLWLVTYGRFDSREAAARAWQQRAQDLPGLEFWVRPWPPE